MSKRILSIDIFRGITIAGMIIVNTPGSWAYVYGPLLHAEWNGYTPTDLVFPFFLWIMGVAMAISFRKFQTDATIPFYRKVIKRTLLIFMIGLLLNAFPFYDKDFSSLRIMGVLQRISIVYFLSAIAVYHLRPYALIAISVLIAIIYTLLLHQYPNPYDPLENIVRDVDLLLIGEDHMWKGLGYAFDPEGLLSTLPAVTTCLFGYLFGRYFFRYKNKLKYIVGAMIVVLSIGYFLSQWQPINKSLWTPTYALITGAIAGIFFVLIYVMVDLLSVKRPFIAFNWLGRNPLFIFVLSIVWVKIYFRIKWIDLDGMHWNMYKYLYQEGFAQWAGNYLGSFFFALAHLFLFVLVAKLLYDRDILIKI